METVVFDLRHFEPRLRGGRLWMDIPSITWSGPIFTDQAIKTLRDAGFSEREVDELVDKLFENITDLTLVKVFRSARLSAASVREE